MLKTRKHLLVSGHTVWTKFVSCLRNSDNTEAVTEVLLLKELTDVVTASALAVLDSGSDSDLLLTLILLDGDLVSKVVAKTANLHLLLKVLDKVGKLEELVGNWRRAVDDERHSKRPNKTRQTLSIFHATICHF